MFSGLRSFSPHRRHGSFFRDRVRTSRCPTSFRLAFLPVTRRWRRQAPMRRSRICREQIDKYNPRVHRYSVGKPIRVIFGLYRNQSKRGMAICSAFFGVCNLVRFCCRESGMTPSSVPPPRFATRCVLTVRYACSMKSHGPRSGPVILTPLTNRNKAA